MKKFLAMLLALAMVAAVFTGCVQSNGTKETTKATEVTEDTQLQEPTGDELEATEPVEDVEPLTGLDATVMSIVEKSPVEFMAGIIPVDLTDTSEDGLWAIKSFTGLSSADKLSAAVAYESMMGSQAFSLVLVQVKDAADAKAVGQEMKDNIDTRKWICVGADQLEVVGSGDVVMLIMVDSGLGLDTESFVTAFTEVMGGTLDFTI